MHVENIFHIIVNGTAANVVVEQLSGAIDNAVDDAAWQREGYVQDYLGRGKSRRHGLP
jgi:hypothetical protein